MPGAYSFVVKFDLFTIHGKTGAVDGPVGAENMTLKGPISKFVKNILRGRAAWGVTHHLTEKWAELPNKTMELSNEEAMPGPKRVRRGGI